MRAKLSVDTSEYIEVKEIMTKENKAKNELSLQGLLGKVFIPTAIFTALYIWIGYGQNAIPSLLLFCILGASVLMPIEMMLILLASKREYGVYSLKSALNQRLPLAWWKVLFYALVLVGIAGLFSMMVAPLEDALLSGISSKTLAVLPAQFDWNNMQLLRSYPHNTLIITCIVYFLFNVFIGPITEELFFRGYLTSQMNRWGKWTPLMITVLFSLYHLWLPFNNIFRILAFYPAAYVGWKKKSVMIPILFHVFCNMFSTVVFIMAVWKG